MSSRSSQDDVKFAALLSTPCPSNEKHAMRIRVLCLHGWRTNAAILRAQTDGLRKALGSEAEFVYLNAPFKAPGPADELVRAFFPKETEFFQWWDAVKRNADTTTSRDRSVYSYEGLEHTLDTLVAQIHARGPFDVVLGFSQGAALTTLLTAHFQRMYHEVPWALCVLVSGFDPRAVETTELMREAYPLGTVDMPSIHVIGSADPMAKHSKSLVERYTDAPTRGVQRLTLEHSEGHKFPTPRLHVDLYKQLATAMTDIVLEQRI